MLSDDTKFLRNHNIIDYSMLLVIEFIDEKNLKKESIRQNNSIYASVFDPDDLLNDSIQPNRSLIGANVSLGINKSSGLGTLITDTRIDKSINRRKKQKHTQIYYIGLIDYL